MLEFLLKCLESGEHMLTVVGVGGTTQQALSHTFIDALIAEIQKVDPMLNEQVALVSPIAESVSPSSIVPTEEQIAAYIAAHPQVTAGGAVKEETFSGVEKAVS
jgi:hypothetical protein